MRRRVRGLWIAAMLPLSGCNPLVLFAPFEHSPRMAIPLNPAPPTEQLADIRLPYALGLHFTPEFTDSRWEVPSNAELTTLDYALGPASRAVFLETFTRLSTAVLLVRHRPPFAPEESVDVALTIEPAVQAFGEAHPSLVREGTYTAHLEYRLVAFDRAGRIVLDKVVTADGEFQGRATRTPATNYAGAAEAAIRSAIVAIAREVARLDVPTE